MAKKAKAKSKPTKSNNFDLQRLVDASGSYKSLIYGVITVVILFVIVFLGVRTLSQNKGEVNETAQTTQDSQEVANAYEVTEGETLWSISEKVYGTGFNWKMIADANKLTDPNNLEAGTKLTIPELTPTAGATSAATATVTATTAPTKVASPSPTQDTKKAEESKQNQQAQKNDTKYTVKKGDYLWKIAIEQYNNGYKWVDIARANKLANPDLIYAGNTLVIPR